MHEPDRTPFSLVDLETADQKGIPRLVLLGAGVSLVGAIGMFAVLLLRFLG